MATQKCIVGTVSGFKGQASSGFTNLDLRHGFIEPFNNVVRSTSVSFQNGNNRHVSAELSNDDRRQKRTNGRSKSTASILDKDQFLSKENSSENKVERKVSTGSHVSLGTKITRWENSQTGLISNGSSSSEMETDESESDSGLICIIGKKLKKTKKDKKKKKKKKRKSYQAFIDAEAIEAGKNSKFENLDEAYIKCRNSKPNFTLKKNFKDESSVGTYSSAHKSRPNSSLLTKTMASHCPKSIRQQNLEHTKFYPEEIDNTENVYIRLGGPICNANITLSDLENLPAMLTVNGNCYKLSSLSFHEVGHYISIILYDKFNVILYDGASSSKAKALPTALKSALKTVSERRCLLSFITYIICENEKLN